MTLPVKLSTKVPDAFGVAPKSVIANHLHNIHVTPYTRNDQNNKYRNHILACLFLAGSFGCIMKSIPIHAK